MKTTLEDCYDRPSRGKDLFAMTIILCGNNLDNKIAFLPNDEAGEIICCFLANNVVNPNKIDQDKNRSQSYYQHDSAFGPNHRANSKSNVLNFLEMTSSKIIWRKGLGSCLGCSGYWTKSDENKNFPFLHGAQRVKISENRIAVIDSEGNVFVNDQNGWHQILLQGDVSNKRSENLATDIALEDKCFLILDKYGTLYSSGIEVSLPGVKISKMAVGSEHCLALSESGVVYSWGSGMRGQLGNGAICQVDAPEVVQGLQGIIITDVKCGGWHSTALSISGDVYMWGWNDVGQLGFHSKSLRSEGVKWHLTGSDCYQCSCPKEDIAENRKYLKSSEKAEKIFYMLNCDRHSDCINVQASPKLLDYWRTDTFVTELACGSRHTVFLLDDHSAWTTGWNKYGQLGIGSTESKDEPQLLSLFPVSKIFAGGWNTAIVQDII